MKDHYKPRDTPQKNQFEIYIPNGYRLDEMIDGDDKGYDFEEVKIVDKEVRLKYGKSREE